MIKFQAAVGPSLERCHIYIVGTDPKMSLCDAVCCARDYKADLTLSNPRMCKKCVVKFWKKWFEVKGPFDVQKPAASDLGVSILEF